MSEKSIHVHELDDLILLLKAINRFSKIPNKMKMAYFAEIEKSIINFIWNSQNNHAQEKQGCRAYTSSFQNVLQS